jgi:DNA-3-methyladenine glycosylase I
MIRCQWVDLKEPLYIAYHDEEWGVPTHDDARLFPMLCLEGAQAGLSWLTILKKRAGYYAAFDNFSAEKMAGYGEDKIAALLADAGIVRNRLKVNAFISNARAYLQICERFGTFDAYIWQFIGAEPKVNYWHALSEIPAETNESRAMSKDLLQRGFKFVGPSICYAFMQACGMVNDHTLDCFKRQEQTLQSD